MAEKIRDSSSTGLALWSRADLMERLSGEVRLRELQGLFPRAAIRAVAAEFDLHPMRVKRFVELYPEA